MTNCVTKRINGFTVYCRRVEYRIVAKYIIITNLLLFYNTIINNKITKSGNSGTR